MLWRLLQKEKLTTMDFSRSSSGQSLLEVVIAIGVIAVLVMGLVVAATSSLRYSQESRLRSSAVKYAQEAIELAREIRDSSTWTVFAQYSGSGTKTWCIDSDGAWTQDSGTGCGPIAPGSQFSRSVMFTWNDPLMQVVSTVSWISGGQTLSTELHTNFTQWQ